MSLRERWEQAKGSIQDTIGHDVEETKRAKAQQAQAVRERVADFDNDMRRGVRRAGRRVSSQEFSPPSRRQDIDTLRAAEEATTMAPPVDATLKPTTSPETVDDWVTSSKPQTPVERAQNGVLGFDIDDFGGEADTGHHEPFDFGFGEDVSDEFADGFESSFDFDFDLGVDDDNGGML